MTACSKSPKLSVVSLVSSHHMKRSYNQLTGGTGNSTYMETRSDHNTAARPLASLEMEQTLKHVKLRSWVLVLWGGAIFIAELTHHSVIIFQWL